MISKLVTAYFMGDNKDLVQRMNKKVIPLLLEYYHE